MHRVKRSLGKSTRAIALFACLAVAAVPVFGQEEADTVKIGDDPAVWLGMAEDLDGRIGAVMDEIKNLGIEDNTYGVCLATYRPISKTRLRIKPWAKYCIAYARKKELGLA